MKKKSQLSSFDILVLSKELRSLLIGGFIDKVYQPKKNELMIKVTIPTNKDEASISVSESTSDSTNSNKQTSETQPRYQQINLSIRLGKFLYAEYKNKDGENADTKVNPSTRQPRPFAMLLRKHLRNGNIIDLYQQEFDRIIVLEVQKQKLFKLVIELFGDGNVILISDGKIVQPLLTQTWSYRTLRAGEEFKFPPSRANPRTIEEPEFYESFKTSDKDLVRTLIMNLDIPGKYAEELCHRVGLDKNIKAAQLTDEDHKKLYECTRALFDQIETAPEALLVFNDAEMTELIELMPVKLELFSELFFKPLENYNSAVERFFNPAHAITGRRQPASKEQREVSQHVDIEHARLMRQYEQQTNAIQKFSDEATLNHDLGEAIYTNYTRCEEILNEINELRAKLKVEPSELLGQVSNSTDIMELNLHKEFVVISLPTGDKNKHLDVKLKLRKNVIKNANSYYEKSKIAKEKGRGAQKALEDSQRSLAKLKTKLDQVQKQAEHKPKHKIIKHFWFEKYHWFITSDGNITVAGRDAKTNDQVVKKYLKDNDRYCHADISGAASVVVKHNPEETEIPEESMQQGCEFALIYSKAWNAKIGAGNAYWVKPDQVSKTPQSGEFLARGAFVIRGKRNHVGNIKLQLAVGEIEYSGKQKLIAGPISAIKTHTNQYVVLAPGDIKKNAMANQLSKVFNIAVDDILSLLPSGEFVLVEKVGFSK